MGSLRNGINIMRAPINPGRIACPKRPRYAFLAAVFLLLAAGCASNKPYQVELMPAPDVYTSGTVDPFAGMESIDDERVPYRGILYATDRKPEEDGESFYENRRGFVLRLGLAKITLGKDDLDWEEARRVSLLKNRTDKYPLQLAGVEEFGVLDRSVSELIDPALLPSDLRMPAETFAGLVNAKLAMSRNKEVLIYVHGYKVVFDNPVLVTTELWHFLGYDGVAIAFAWPSTPSTWAYMSDLETAALSAHSLRVLVQYLAEETRAERINIIGYSAGTRVVIDALDQLSLMSAGREADAPQHELPIGQVILVGSDYDRDLFGAALMNGLLNVPQRLTIYLSETDKALGMSQWLFGRNRLGQMWTERPLKPHVTDYVRRNQSLVLVDVTGAEAADAGNGHAYFRKSPWVSSDILVSLLYQLEPEQRGLVRLPDMPVWSFPEDYLSRLQSLLQAKLRAD
jgi:esterase/lipase superfamily enzyme